MKKEFIKFAAILAFVLFIFFPVEVVFYSWIHERIIDRVILLENNQRAIAEALNDLSDDITGYRPLLLIPDRVGPVRGETRKARQP